MKKRNVHIGNRRHKESPARRGLVKPGKEGHMEQREMTRRIREDLGELIEKATYEEARLLWIVAREIVKGSEV